MKKILYVLLVFSLVFIVTGCGSNRKLNVIGDKLYIKFDGCAIKEFKDTHGGFLGDGDTYAKIVCDDSFDKKIIMEWDELPLPNKLSNALNMEQCTGNGCFDVYEKYNIPRLENGRYFWRDTGPDYDDSEHNLTNYYIGIYDEENNIIYYYEYDS